MTKNVLSKWGLLVSILCFVQPGFLQAQEKYFTKTGVISFFSKAPLEDIAARNQQVVSFLDMKTGELVFSVSMKAFQFEKPLMQEHFNENYVESHKYPKASFKGKVLNIQEINLLQDKNYPVTLEGILNIHGVDRKLKTAATIEVKGHHLEAKAQFYITPQEFTIEIPFLMKEYIARRIDITVDMLYKPYVEKRP